MFGALILATALAACRKHEPVAAGGSNVEIDRSGKNAAIRTVDATPSGGAPAPAGFPKDVPIYPGARAAAASEGATHVATLETPDWPDDVAKFYLGKLPRWTTAMDMKTDDGRTLLLKSPDGKRSLTLAATREALKTVVTLTVSPR
jgi:hypothetical protein